MTEREQDALDAIFGDPGIGIKQISAKLDISEARAGALVAQLSEKFGVVGPLRLYLAAERLGYAPSPTNGTAQPVAIATKQQEFKAN